ncbi:hypothetical protein SS50377_25570 [Spironucleus salmonicida]|uniref:Uncharacterized protein n=1 Tax=Spironucleus salmonicida TaxID=348837 RepID=A0A9P8LSM0_9EUKA|nr:hypothetical protein SS50377_25570 [Spironucleus salmonicida]
MRSYQYYSILANFYIITKLTAKQLNKAPNRIPPTIQYKQWYPSIYLSKETKSNINTQAAILCYQKYITIMYPDQNIECAEGNPLSSDDGRGNYIINLQEADTKIFRNQIIPKLIRSNYLDFDLVIRNYITSAIPAIYGEQCSSFIIL